MNQFFNYLKDEYRSKSTLLIAIGVVLSLFTALCAFIIDLLSSKISLFILATIVFLICIGFSMYILKFSSETAERRQKQQKKVIIIRVCASISYLGIILFLIFPFQNLIKQQSELCSSNLTENIIVSNFSIANRQDNFSYKLVSLLKSKNEFNDSITISSTNKFIEIGSPSLNDTILKQFEVFCSKKGLYVFGKRAIDEKLFDCNLFINNLHNLNIPQNLQTKNSPIIYLQKPTLLSFSIDEQAETVANFILGILSMDNKSYKQALNYFADYKKSKSVKSSPSFEFYTTFFIANSYIAMDSISKSVEYYNKAINLDPSKQYCYFNLAIAYARLRDYDKAKSVLSGMKNNAEKLKLGRIIEDQLNDAMKIVKTTNYKKLDFNAKREKKVVTTDSVKNLMPVIKRNELGKWGVLSSNTVLIPFQYDYIEKYSLKNIDYYIVEDNKKFGCFDKEGNVYIAIKQNSIKIIRSLIFMNNNKDDINLIGY
ncbi:MAG: hypothetical protein JWQ25_423 [Daejeonella sp.]|nr:hypothetical protein [Daejeonella sp.]